MNEEEQVKRLLDIEPIVSTDDYYTPAWVFEQMDVEFDVDVAAPPGGVPWIPAKKFYTENDNGLEQPWSGFVWCNPPYSAPSRWLDKMRKHSNGIILIRADLSSGAYHRAFTDADYLHVPRGRLQFVNGHGGVTSSVTFTTVLLGFGSQAGDALTRLDGCTRRLIEIT